MVTVCWAASASPTPRADHLLTLIFTATLTRHPTLSATPTPTLTLRSAVR